RIRGERADNLEQAIAHYELALQVRTRAAFPEQWATTQNNLANAYNNCIRGERADNLEQAIAHYELALQVYTRAAFPTDWAMTQNNLATTYNNRIRGERADNLEQAIAHYQNALQIHTPQAYPGDARKTARNLGNLYSEIQKWNEARSTYATALTAAEQLFRNAIDPTTQRAEAEELADLYDRDIRACVGLDERRRTNDDGGRTTKDESIRPSSFVLHPSADALVSAEAARSRAFLKQMGQGDYAAPPEISSALREREARLRDDFRRNEAALASVNTRSDRASETERALVAQRAALNRQLDAVWDEMLAVASSASSAPAGRGGSAAREYVALRRGETPKWDALRELAGQIGKDAALVEFHTLDTQIVALVWRAGGDAPQLIALPIDRARLLYRYLLPYEQEVINHRHHTEIARRETHNAWLALGEELLAPLQPALDDASLVYFIPHSYLHLLPLHALSVRGKPFIAERAVAYAPSAAVLARAIATAADRPPTVGNGQALAMGYTPPPWIREHFVGEAQEIANLFAGSNLFVDHQATRAALTQHAPQSKIIHLSCHGFFNANDPLASFVLLAGDDKYTAREWMRLRLDADLVTLSACQLAFSETNRGDDLVGMARALFYAGASSLLLALWSVRSDTTKEWMVDFFKRVWRNGVKQQPLAAAHRAATLELMRAHPNEPHIWAPFVLMGNWA
ncbi:MAG: CHAT domain-containing tetratricopeptide repeat protein, partial [Chloroflexota bacterium]